MNRHGLLRFGWSGVAVLGCALAGTLLAGLAGCNKESGSAGGKPSIAVIPKGTSHEYWQSVKAGAEAAGKDLNVDIIYQGTLNEDDHSGQIAKVTEFTADKVAGIVLAPQDANALVRPVQAAKAAGIPVVIFDSKLEGTPGADYVALVATDNEKAGEMGGETLAKLLNYKGKVVLLRYEHGSASTDDREAGFLKVMDKYKDKGITVISSNQEGGSTTDSAKSKAMSMVDDLNAADGIFCPNESSAHGMLLAMVDHLNNKPVAAIIDTGAAIITRDNMNTPEMQQLMK